MLRPVPVRTILFSRNPWASMSARKSVSVRSRDPCATSMLRSARARFWCMADASICPGISPSINSSLADGGIAWRQLRRMTAPWASSQSWITLLTR